MSESQQSILPKIAGELRLSENQVRATIELLDAGNTIPFITRYRKDHTQGLNEEQIEQIRDRITTLRQMEQRRETILRSIESQNKLTDDLRNAVMSATTTRELEDLYAPYRPKKQTLATKAREQGLEILANEIVEADKAATDLDARAADFINEDKKVLSAAEALLGAGHILAERYYERADLRGAARAKFLKSAKLVAVATTEDQAKRNQYKDYVDYKEPLHKVPPHRVLAINRGEKAGILKVDVEANIDELNALGRQLLVDPEHPHASFLFGCVDDAVVRLLLPFLQREARRDLTERSEEHAVTVFARNLKNLLLQSPLPGKRVLAIDPGFKNGCKMAALDEFGKPLDHAIVHIVGSDERKASARQKMIELIDQHDLNVVAVGNGTACRDTEQLLAEIFSTELAERDISYTVVNEAGASVYSTSPIGREEFPDCDPAERGAISIGRRLQDPLSELVKIDPASIGVGLYQHDTKAKHLKDTLDEVVQSCVSYVGVDINSASASLLRYVSGLNHLTARRVFEHRQQNGPFQARQQLMEVPGIGESTFEQAAGFLKIQGGSEPLDATWIHPESYEAAHRLLTELQVPVDAVAGNTEETTLAQKIASAVEPLDRGELATQLEVGPLSLDDMIQALMRPGRDPRTDLPPPLFRKDVVRFEDLAVGMELAGTVLNVVDFGAFVDVGLSDSGLVHISQLSGKFVQDPHEVVSVGDRVRVWVTAIDAERRRVSLTMIEPGTERPAESRRPKRRGRRKVGAGKGEAAKSGAARQGSRNQRGRQQKRGRGRQPPKPKKPLIPLTEEMAEGKEPMRTFGDLLQFYEHKKDDSPDSK